MQHGSLTAAAVLFFTAEPYPFAGRVDDLHQRDAGRDLP